MKNAPPEHRHPVLLSKRSRKFRGFLASALLLWALYPRSFQADAGDLDLTFGTGGKVTTDFGATALSSSFINDVALQPDGKIVAAGIFHRADFDRDLAVARYNKDGSLDPSFGTGGKVITDLGVNLFSEFSQAIAIQPDGKILIAVSGGAVFTVSLVRYNADGSPDLSFGSGGMVITDVRGTLSQRLVLQPDGKILLTGVAISGFFTDFETARYNPDGSLDLTFGKGGKVITDFHNFADFPSSISLQADGKILVGGRGARADFSEEFVLVRYDPSGAPDLTFGEAGKVSTDFFGGSDEIISLKITGDGKIIAAGIARQPREFRGPLALARYNPDGSLDAAFGQGGKMTGPVPDIFTPPRAIAFQPDGKIVTAAVAFTNSQDFGVARYNPDATLDPGFGTDGIAFTDFEGDLEFPSSMVIQPDGGIIISGGARIGLNLHFALVRYEGDGPEFGLCIEDDVNGKRMEINTDTGGYRFTDCSGFTLSGTGLLMKQGGIITLQHNSRDRRVFVRVDTVANKATASIRLSTPGTISIVDRNINNNTCLCRR